MRKLSLVLAMLALTACNAIHDVVEPAFNGVRGHVGVTNGPRHGINIYMNHKLIGSMSADQSQASFIIEVPIPNYENSDSYDSFAYPLFSVEDVTTGGKTLEQTCMAGAKVITSLSYTIDVYGSGPYATYNPRLTCS